jgi:hypothetical protein
MTSFKKKEVNMTNFKRTIRDFTEIADLIAAETAAPNSDFTTAFSSDLDGVRFARGEDELLADMPDPMQVQLATELLIGTVFDVLRDTRLERVAERVTWGIVNSLHSTARGLAGQADDAAREVKDLIRCADGSEVMMNELEAAQAKCRELDEANDAIACMRDHAAAAFSAETASSWGSARGSLVSSKRTASVIDATDFLAARRNRRIDQHHPQGPIVAFSGGAAWDDYRPIHAALDRVKAFIPNMVLLTTAQDTGADAIAESWAAANDVKLVRLGLPKGLGKRAGFVRNDRIVALRPADAIICEGSGIQAHLARILGEAGVRPRLISRNGEAPVWARAR